MFKTQLKFAAYLLASTCFISTASSIAFAEDDKSLTFAEAISSGKVTGNMRYRYEMVDQDGFAENANASTLRTKLSYTTGAFYNFSAKVEFENSTNIFSDKYNSTTNGKGMYPVVADPDHTEVNQAYLAYTGIDDTTIVVGRQAVNFDNQRFIGTVGFRQNDQTYDAAAIVNNSIKDTTIVYGYVWNVNRIFGDNHAFGNLATNTHILNIGYKGIEGVKISAYAYLVDLDHAAVKGLNAQTYGIRLAGKTPVSDDLKIIYALEYANQSNYAENPTKFSTNYFLAEAGINVSGFTVKASYEALGSDEGNYSFKTPLATLHKFNGWADKFLGTPVNGLNDLYITGSYVVKNDSALDGLKITAIYHKFTSQFGDIDYGTEFDAVISKNLDKTFNLSVKYAKYYADTYATDTSKLWLTLGAKF
jgi:hypothetical protein